MEHFTSKAKFKNNPGLIDKVDSLNILGEFIYILAGLPRYLKILESPGIGKRKFQVLESP